MAKEKIFQALAVSPGIAIGRAKRIISCGASYTTPEDIDISDAEVNSELRKFEEAKELTKNDLLALRERLRTKLDSGEAKIFDAHLMIVDDASIGKSVRELIVKDHRTAAFAFFKTVEKFAAALEALDDEYLKERAVDIRDVAARLMNNLRNEHTDDESGVIEDRRIILAHELTPSDTAALNRDKVLGFAVETGSTTSHTAILARSMHLPAVVGVAREVLETGINDTVIIDGYSGRVIINPEHRTEEAYRLKQQQAGELYDNLLQEKALQSETQDGFQIQLAANLEKVEDAALAIQYGAYGVGLFRTEFLFLGRVAPPTEDEQFDLYKKLLLSMDNKPVIIRTLDIGGDKLSSALYRTGEQNPFLGLRGIRLCLHERQDIFRTQLRALLRAGVYGNLRIMFPMLTCFEELIEIRAILEEVKQELVAEKHDFVQQPSLGAMIETPAAALMVDRFAELIDFVSIGTNDLVQYTMSIDRSNEKVAYLYRPSNPAVLELIKRCVEAAKRHNIWVSICGQLAAEPQYIPLLVGLGVNELSMDPNSLGISRRIVRSLKMCEAESLADKALNAGSAAESLAMSIDLLRKSAPKVADLVMLQTPLHVTHNGATKQLN